MDPLVITRPSSLNLRDYPHIFMPPKAIPVNRVGFAMIAPGATFVLAPDLSNQILIPVLQKGWLTQLAVYLGSYGSGQVWSLTQNGIAMRDYTKVPVGIGAPETPVTRQIELFPQQPLALIFFNGSGQPLSASWSMYGWYYPQR